MLHKMRVRKGGGFLVLVCEYEKLAAIEEKRCVKPRSGAINPTADWLTRPHGAGPAPSLELEALDTWVPVLSATF